MKLLTALFMLCLLLGDIGIVIYIVLYVRKVKKAHLETGIKVSRKMHDLLRIVYAGSILIASVVFLLLLFEINR